MTQSFENARGYARMLFALLGVLLLAAGAASAQSAYRFQRLVGLLDLTEDARLTLDGWIEIGTLDDEGRLVFGTLSGSDTGGKNLLQYDGGALLPIARPRGLGPGQVWPEDLDFASPVSMNQRGSVAFAATTSTAGARRYGVFVRDGRTRQIRPIALPGTPIGAGLAIETAVHCAPVINRGDEIAFAAAVRSTTGSAEPGVLLARGGSLLPVALPGQDLPGGGKIEAAILPSLCDTGAVAFLARRQGEQELGAYLWQDGTLTAVAPAGSRLPDGTILAAVTAVRLNNGDGRVMVQGRLLGAAGDGLYAFSNGALVPIALPGQPMPDGGWLATLLFPGVPGGHGLSFANERGEHAFIAQLADGTTAAYRVDADGRLFLILKSGTITHLGAITSVAAATDRFPSMGVGLNAKGEVALPVQIDGHPAAIALLSPNAP